jgi:hypothetical protein
MYLTTSTATSHVAEGKLKKFENRFLAVHEGMLKRCTSRLET